MYRGPATSYFFISEESAMRLLNFHAKLEGMFLENDEECHVSEVKNQDTELKISLWSKKQSSFIQESLIFI